MRETINALGARKTYEHDAFSRVKVETNEVGETTEHEYDQAKRSHTIRPPIKGTDDKNYYC